MPYEVTVPELTLLESVGEIKAEDGRVIGHDHRSNQYVLGDVVPDDKVSPVVVELYDAGDEHTTSVLSRVDEDAPAPKPAAKARKAKAAASPEVKADSADDAE